MHGLDQHQGIPFFPAGRLEDDEAVRDVRDRRGILRDQPDGGVLQRAERADAVKLGGHHGRRPDPQPQGRLGDQEPESLAPVEQRDLAVEAPRDDSGDVELGVRGLEDGEHPACVLGGLKQPGDHGRLVDQLGPGLILDLLDIVLKVGPAAHRGVPRMHLGVGRVGQHQQLLGCAGGCADGGRPCAHLRDGRHGRAGFDP